MKEHEYIWEIWKGNNIQFKNWKAEKIIWGWKTYDSMLEAMPLKDVSR